MKFIKIFTRTLLWLGDEVMILGVLPLCLSFLLIIPMEIITFSQIMRLHFKNEFIVSSLNAETMSQASLHPTQPVNAQ